MLQHNDRSAVYIVEEVFVEKVVLLVLSIFMTDCLIVLFFTLPIFLFSVFILSCASPLFLPSLYIPPAHHPTLSLNSLNPSTSCLSIFYSVDLIPLLPVLPTFPSSPPLPLSLPFFRSLSQGSTNSNMLDVQGGAHKKRVRRSSLLNAKKLYEDAQMARKVKQYLSNLTVETDEEKHQILSLQCEPSYSTCT